MPQNSPVLARNSPGNPEPTDEELPNLFAYLWRPVLLIIREYSTTFPIVLSNNSATRCRWGLQFHSLFAEGRLCKTAKP